MPRRCSQCLRAVQSLYPIEVGAAVEESWRAARLTYFAAAWRPTDRQGVVPEGGSASNP